MQILMVEELQEQLDPEKLDMLILEEDTLIILMD